ncbi:hypothetical protein [Nitrobacter sp.]|uniref:hypothetical protein n=1 Tax=Nitrobacter sp. TaxID=29420 RepID=UPI003F65364C
MNSIETAPRDGRFVAVSTGTGNLSFAYFENGVWIAPQIVGKPELGSAVIDPIWWLDIPVPSRH